MLLLFTINIDKNLKSPFNNINLTYKKINYFNDKIKEKKNGVYHFSFVAAQGFEPNR